MRMWGIKPRRMVPHQLVFKIICMRLISSSARIQDSSLQRTLVSQMKMKYFASDTHAHVVKAC